MSNLAIVARLDPRDENTDGDDNEVMPVIGGIGYGISKGVKKIFTLHHLDDKSKDISTQEIVVQTHIRF